MGSEGDRVTPNHGVPYEHTPRRRFLDVLNFRRPAEPPAMVEWAPWWDRTTARWEREGLSGGMDLETSVLFRA